MDKNNVRLLTFVDVLSDKAGDDWVLVCRNVVVAEVRCADRGGLGMNV